MLSIAVGILPLPRKERRHRHDLSLRLIVRIMTRDEILEKCCLRSRHSLLNDADQVAHHQQNLTDGYDIEHRGMTVTTIPVAA